MKKSNIGLLILMLLAMAACSGLPGENPETPAPPTAIEGEMIRGPVYMSQTSILIMESFPIQVAVQIQGELPTPCHTLRSQIGEPDVNNEIRIDVFSEAAADVVCVQVLQPFEESLRLPMEGKPDGTYRVYINGELVGEFSYPG